MDRQFYIENLLDHYENPRNRYTMEDASVSIKGGNPGCGDIVTIYLKVDAEERVLAASFEGEGCTISQAAASMLTEMLIGKTLSEVREMDIDAFIDEIGREVVISRPKCATLAINTAKAAERKYRAEQAKAD
ncbi:MAG: iron-sulfur cluster assembly scaffold protein [Chloroflexi bacterium CFX4]|nr:iron-sulfur cluster assembly scaffold protein [Chloroflexi bacterium CFX4]MDL1923293.1 iron-sulfur cluster assembly scaffold protein [Chloroflexi bacterium CFX3]